MARNITSRNVFQACVPEGLSPGAHFRVATPNGQQMVVQVPPNSYPGMVLLLTPQETQTPQPQNLNGYAVPCKDKESQGRFSFLAHTVDDPAFRSLVGESSIVDLEREYTYPVRYDLLSKVGGCLVFTFWTLYVCSPPFMESLRRQTLDTFSTLYAYVFLGWCVVCLLFFSCHCCFYLGMPQASPPQPLSRREFRNVMGTTGIAGASLMYCVYGFGTNIMQDMQQRTGFYHVFGFVCVCLTSIVYIGIAYFVMKRRVKVPIKPGLVLSIFWTGAVFATTMAGLLNSFFLLAIWPRLDPSCNIGQDMGGHKLGKSREGTACLVVKWVQWIFTAGLNEEILNSETPGIPCCAWFFKLASSPAVVVLSGMASGAGFATLENIQYVDRIQGMYKAGADGVSQWTASIRLLSASIHICMTGTCAVALAYEKFLAPKYWVLKYIAVFAMMVLHGSFNASTTWGDVFITLSIAAFINIQFFFWFFLTLVHMEPEFQQRQVSQHAGTDLPSQVTGTGTELPSFPLPTP